MIRRFNLKTVGRIMTSALLLIAVVDVSVVSAQESAQTVFNELLKSAMAHNKAREFELAIRDLTDAIKLAPKMGMVYGFRGAMYFELRENAKALGDFDEALRLEPAMEGPIHGLRGLALFNLQRWDEAIKSFDVQLRLDEKDFRSFTLRGKAYTEKKEYQLAIDDFTTAIRLDAKLSRAHTFRAEAFLFTGDFAGAVRDASEEIRLSPELILPYEIRAKAYRKLGKTELAQADEKKANELKGK